MIESYNSDIALKFANISEEEKKSRGILGRLYGPVAEFKAPTRNGRKYSQELWERLFESPLIKERFNAGGIMGELQHPDRSDIDFEKVAVVMHEPPVKNSDGQLIGCLDIVDLPCGRVAYQLAKYGYKFGISSRGEGDLITDSEGDEAVDPETYTLSAFDLVEIPAVKSARLAFTESLDTKKKSLTESLKNLVDNATEEDKKIMNEAIEKLGLDLQEDKLNIDDYEEVDDKLEGNDRYYIFRKVVNGRGVWAAKKGEDGEPFEITYEQALGYEPITEDMCIDKTEEAEEVVDDESKKLVAELQEALQKIKTLEETNLSLKEQLSVCNAKDAEVSAELTRYKSATIVLSDSAKSLKSNVKDLQESLDAKEREVKANEHRISDLTESINQLKTSIKPDRTEEVEHLTKELENSMKQLKESKLLVTKYKASYSALKESYLDTQAKIYGVPNEDVHKQLGESYKLKDIERVCEELAEKKRKLNELPFTLNENTHISVKKSVNEYIGGSNKNDSSDDFVSDALRLMANL